MGVDALITVSLVMINIVWWFIAGYQIWSLWCDRSEKQGSKKAADGWSQHF